MKRWTLLAAMLLATSCGGRITIPPCILDGSCLPIPSAPPSPVASPAPEPSAVPSPSPQPSPVPVPTPSPVSTPPPSPSPVPSPVDAGIIPKLNECPAGWPTTVDFVTIGSVPHRAGANPNAWLFNVTPRRTDPKYCLDENGASRMQGGQCDEWMPCGLRRNPDGSWLYMVAARAWGPGPFADGGEVERRGDNPNLLNFVLGAAGSPPGDYHVCVAPTPAELAAAVNTNCTDANLTLEGQ